jgi:hypothetical protein
MSGSIPPIATPFRRQPLFIDYPPQPPPMSPNDFAGRSFQKTVGYSDPRDGDVKQAAGVLHRLLQHVLTCPLTEAPAPAAPPALTHPQYGWPPPPYAYHPAPWGPYAPLALSMPKEAPPPVDQRTVHEEVWRAVGTLRRYDALERDAAEGRAAVAAEWRCEWDALAEEEAKVRCRVRDMPLPATANPLAPHRKVPNPTAVHDPTTTGTTGDDDGPCPHLQQRTPTKRRHKSRRKVTGQPPTAPTSPFFLQSPPKIHPRPPNSPRRPLAAWAPPPPVPVVDRHTELVPAADERLIESPRSRRLRKKGHRSRPKTQGPSARTQSPAPAASHSAMAFERTVVASPPRAVLAAPEADPDRLAEAPIDGEDDPCDQAPVSSTAERTLHAVAVLQRAPGGHAKDLSVLQDADFRLEAAMAYTVHAARQEAPPFAIECAEYCPNVFASLRAWHGVTDESWRAAWLFEHPTSPLRSDGRKGSISLRSSDGRFLLQTIPREEVEVLIGNTARFLRAYCTHLRANTSSLLQRLCGLYRFALPGGVVWALVVSDPHRHPSGLPVTERFELQGRQRKGRDPVTLPNGVVKDDALQRGFSVPLTTRAAFLHQLWADVRFLAAHRLTGYRLSVGVVPHTLRPHDSLLGLQVPPAAAGAVWLAGGTADRPECYTVGIVGFLTVYGAQKAVAHFFKSCVWGREQLAAVDPAYFASRLENYVAQVFEAPT